MEIAYRQQVFGRFPGVLFIAGPSPGKAKGVDSMKTLPADVKQTPAFSRVGKRRRFTIAVRLLEHIPHVLLQNVIGLVQFLEMCQVLVLHHQPGMVTIECSEYDGRIWGNIPFLCQSRYATDKGCRQTNN